MTEKYYNITGIPVKPGQKPPLRLECNEWAQDNPIQLSLFIRALTKFYQVSYTDTLSFYQIASIHGYPGNLEWDHGGPPPFQNDPSDPHYIYCTHNTPLFPAWHRPYMLLFEQRLWELMKDVINNDLKFEVSGDKDKWLDQANQWRLPYWDWSLIHQYGIPEIFTTSEIDIVPPRKETGLAVLDSVTNPLNRFLLLQNNKPTAWGKLPEPYTVPDNVYGGVQLPWSQTSGTSRWGIFGTYQAGKPLPEEESEGVNNWNGSNEAIKEHQYYINNPQLQAQSVSSLVYRLLAPGNVKTWDEFSTTLYTPKNPPTWEGYINVEFIHNNLHNFIGGLSMKTGLGHMSDVPVAAFDPVFYMHHCNIDRQLAIWQTLNPKEWFAEGESMPPGSPTGKSPLPPFRHKTETMEDFEFYKPDAVRDWTKLGYQYDVLERQDGENDQEYRDRIIRSLDRYDDTGKRLLQAGHAVLGAPELKGRDEEAEYDDYIINVVYDRYALNGNPYTIHFFLDNVTAEDIDSNPLGAPYLKSHIGSIVNFSANLDSTGQQCANCKKQADAGELCSALIPITTTLFDRISTSPSFTGSVDLGPEAIESILIPGLHWAATDVSGNAIDADLLQKTKVLVLKGKGKHFTSDSKMSEYGSYTPMPRVTESKVWGANESEYDSPTRNFGS